MSTADSGVSDSGDEKELQGGAQGEPEDPFGELDNSNLYSSYGAGEFGSEHQFLHANLWESEQAAVRKKQTKGGAPGEDEDDSFYSFSDASSMIAKEVEPKAVEHPILWNLRIISICLLQLGASVQVLVFLSILLPLQVFAIAGNTEKGSYLGLLMLMGGLISLVSPPFIGILSDRLRSRMGRRRPFILAGMIVNAAGLLGLAFAEKNAGMLISFYILVLIGTNLMLTAFNAAVFSVVPKQQFGTASGIIGALQVLGFGVGTGISSAVHRIGIKTTYGVVCAVVSGTAIVTLLAFKEERTDRNVRVMDSEDVAESLLEKTQPKLRFRALVQKLASPFALPDFKWIFVSRLFIQMGVYTVQEFLLYWVKDVLPISTVSPSTATAMLFIPIGFTSFLSSIVIGKVSDYLGGRRKSFLVWSCTLMGVLSTLLAVTRNYAVALVIFSVFGFAVGIFLALDYALICDVIPDDDNVACSLGVWHVSIALPQLFVSPLAGFLLDTLQQLGAREKIPGLGYIVLFLLVAIYFFIAALLFQRLQTIK